MAGIDVFAPMLEIPYKFGQGTQTENKLQFNTIIEQSEFDHYFSTIGYINVTTIALVRLTWALLFLLLG